MGIGILAIELSCHSVHGAGNARRATGPISRRTLRRPGVPAAGGRSKRHGPEMQGAALKIFVVSNSTVTTPGMPLGDAQTGS